MRRFDHALVIAEPETTRIHVRPRVAAPRIHWPIKATIPNWISVDGQRRLLQ
jgi:hypothetical protein